MDKSKLDNLKSKAYDLIRNYEQIQNKFKATIDRIQKELTDVNQEIFEIENKEKKSG